MTVSMYRALDRHFPEADAITHGEWVRREAALADPPPRFVRPDERPRCVVCDRSFTAKHPTQRFCERACRVWWHGGVGAAERRRAAA